MTTRHDIDLRAQADGVLRGRLSVDGVGAIGWTASLVHKESADIVDPVRSVALDAASGVIHSDGALSAGGGDCAAPSRSTAKAAATVISPRRP